MKCMTENRGTCMVIEESRMKCDFSNSQKTIKFDDTDFYKNLFNCISGAKGVDFISVGKEYTAFIEIKNCLGDEGNNRWRIFPNNSKKDTSHTTVDIEGRDSLDIEIPQKMAMTLAGLTGVLSFGDSKSSLEDIKEIAEEILLHYFKDNKKKLYVILFLEGNFGGHTRTKKMIMTELQRSMNAKLRWLNCKVSVVDSSTYNRQIFELAS